MNRGRAPFKVLEFSCPGHLEPAVLPLSATRAMRPHHLRCTSPPSRRAGGGKITHNRCHSFVSAQATHEWGPCRHPGAPKTPPCGRRGRAHVVCCQLSCFNLAWEPARIEPCNVSSIVLTRISTQSPKKSTTVCPHQHPRPVTAGGGRNGQPRARHDALLQTRRSSGVSAAREALTGRETKISWISAALAWRPIMHADGHGTLC